MKSEARKSGGSKPGGFLGGVVLSWHSLALRRRLLLALGILGTLGFAAMALHRVWSVHQPFDDAFISFRYADNLARGNGIVYNPGEPVEGYTNFLWVLLVALGIRLGIEPLTFALVLGKGAFVGSVVLCSLLIQRGARDHVSDLLGLAPLAWLVFVTDFERLAASGLETSFFGAILLAFLLSEFRWDASEHWRFAWVHGLLPTALVWTRPDGMIFVLPVLGLCFLSTVKDSWRERSWYSAWMVGARALARRYWALFGLVGAHCLWKLCYYGSVVPNTAYAKSAGESHWESGWAYLQAYLASYPHVLILLVLAIVGVGLPPHPRLKWFGMGAGLGLAGFILYVVKVGGDFMHYRFMFEVYPLLVGMAGLGVLGLARLSPLVAAACTALAFSLGPGVPKLEAQFAMQTIEDMVRYVREGEKAGKALAANTPPDIILASTLAGTMAYYSDRVIIDQWGLNDAYVARLPGGSLRGHMKGAPVDYMRERGVHLVLGHPWFLGCSQTAREASRKKTKGPLVFLKLETGDCLRAQYLVQTPAMTQWFCDRPEAFLLDGIACDRE